MFFDKLRKKKSKELDETPNDNPQKWAFDYLKTRLPDELSMAEVLMSQLNISQDSAYRRLRGETQLTLQEIKILVEYFNLSLDELFGLKGRGDAVLFYSQRLNNENYLEYLEFIYKEFKQSPVFGDQKLIHSAKDIPSFYFFLFPELAVFKAYFFGRVLWSSTFFQGQKFNIKVVNELLNGPLLEMKRVSEKIAQAYIQFSGVEIWNNNTINGHLYQIKYMWDSGLFESKECAIHIVMETEKMLNLIRKQAEDGCKYYSTDFEKSGGQFDLYYSEGIHLENTVVKSTNDQIRCYLLHNTGDYLITTDPNFCGRTKDYLENVMRKSGLISRSGEKDRHRMFSNYQDKLDFLKKSIS